MLYIFDKDGTLVEELPDPKLGTRPANTPEEQRLIPGVYDKIAELKAAGHHIWIASNQGGVSWGFITYRQAIDVMADACNKIGIIRNNYAFCPYDERGKFASEYSQWKHYRKPLPGMIEAIADYEGESRDRVIYIGDHDTDRQAAEAAGVKFMWAKDFFCDHNEMIANDDPAFAWKCAKCGYVYGK